jgi:L,D-peptidoglycan transpeptidase YkuD (ErfK/YbiS/YcfS/YnhG family)
LAVFIAFADGRFDLNGRWTRCALGRGGVVEAAAKQEGDGAAPLGSWPLRRLLYRADKGPAPPTGLAVQPITPDDGWCDAPEDPAYNSPVRLPYPASHERLWREDALYDRVVVLGHNDDPPIAGVGSAIFLHVAREGYGPTEGCVALTREDIDDLLRQARPGDSLEIRP